MKRLSALQSRSPRPYDSDLEPIEKSAGLRQIWASLRLLRDADRLPYGRAIKRVCLGPLEQVYRPRSFAGPRQSRGSSGKGFRRWPNPDIDAWPIPPTQYPCAGTYGRVTAETLEDTGLVGRLGLPPFSCKIGQ